MKTLTLLLALLLGACSAAPARGPEAVSIDPAFSPEQYQAAYDAVDAWNVAAGLSVRVAPWGTEGAVPILRDDSLVAETYLGKTHTESVEKQNDYIRIAGAGCFPKGGECVEQFDFQTTVAHELGHLYGMNHIHDKGCDGYGHSSSPADLMYAHGTADGVRHEISDNDVARVIEAIEVAW